MDFLGDGKSLDMGAIILPGMRVTVPGHDRPAEVIAVYYRGFRKPDLLRLSIPGVGVIDLPETDVRKADSES